MGVGRARLRVAGGVHEAARGLPRRVEGRDRLTADWVEGTRGVHGVPVWFRRRPAENESAGSPAPRVLLLHGGLSDSRAFDALVAELPPGLELWSYDRRGQGRTPDIDAPLGLDSMLAEAVVMIEFVGAPVHLVGHSDGASLALLLAARRPDLVASVCAFSGNLDPGGLVEGSLSVDQLVEAVSDEYGAVSPDGLEHLPVMAEKILTLWATEPRMTVAEIGGIRCPVLVAAGEDDSIRDDHTRSIHAAIPGARLSIVAGAGHMLIEQEARYCAALVGALILPER